MADVLELTIEFLIGTYQSLNNIVVLFFEFLDFELTSSVLSTLINALGNLFPNWQDVEISFTVGQALFGSGLVTVLLIIIFKWIVPLW